MAPLIKLARGHNKVRLVKPSMLGQTNALCMRVLANTLTQEVSSSGSFLQPTGTKPNDSSKACEQVYIVL